MDAWGNDDDQGSGDREWAIWPLSILAILLLALLCWGGWHLVRTLIG